MHPDRHGEMGFNEAIISMMAVSIILSLFLVFVATSAVTSYDPLEGFDPDALEIEATEDITISHSYLYSCLATMDISGIEVTISVPHFHEEKVVFDAGKITNLQSSRSFMRVIDYLNGRTVPAIIEVVAYA